ALFVERDNRSVNLAQSNWYDRARVDPAEFSPREFRARAQTDKKFLAPHFVQQVLESFHERDEIVTTLDLEKQQAIERRIAEYNPENFDREFLGPIRACDALARSRNVPAVELTSHLLHPTLYQFLKNAGVSLPKAESFYGLALPLGSAEVSMQDLVRLYAALANNGDLRPLQSVKAEIESANQPVKKLTALSSQVSVKRILSPEAAFLTLEMLGNVLRPEMNCADGSHSAPVYWKTGTSHGFRDAWSI